MLTSSVAKLETGPKYAIQKPHSLELLVAAPLQKNADKTFKHKFSDSSYWLPAKFDRKQTPTVFGYLLLA